MSDNRAVAIMPFKYDEETVYRVGTVNADWDLNTTSTSHMYWVCMDPETTTSDYALAKLYAEDLAEKEQVEYGIINNDIYKDMDHRAIDDYTEIVMEYRQALITGEQPYINGASYDVTSRWR